MKKLTETFLGYLLLNNHTTEESKKYTHQDEQIDIMRLSIDCNLDVLWKLNIGARIADFHVFDRLGIQAKISTL